MKFPAKSRCSDARAYLRCYRVSNPQRIDIFKTEDFIEYRGSDKVETYKIDEVIREGQFEECLSVSMSSLWREVVVGRLVEGESGPTLYFLCVFEARRIHASSLTKDQSMTVEEHRSARRFISFSHALGRLVDIDDDQSSSVVLTVSFTMLYDLDCSLKVVHHHSSSSALFEASRNGAKIGGKTGDNIPRV